ncbi:MAG: VOC family protein [Clostridia bacterium]|nr:VOC family protein [Clostridia bacterium]
MNIEHVALWTNDLERSKIFYETYFKGKAGEKYISKRESFESYFITFDSGSRLELMKMPGISDNRETKIVTGYVHIAFSVGSREKVDYLTTVMKQDGYMVVSDPRTTGDGYYESCVLDPDGNRVEITE